MSNSSTSAHLHPVVEALNTADEALASVQDSTVWALSDDELSGAIEHCERLAAKHAELRLRLVAEADGRDLGRWLGASSTVAWLRHRFRIASADARALVDVANRVTASADGPVDYAANVSLPATGREMLLPALPWLPESCPSGMRL